MSARKPSGDDLHVHVFLQEVDGVAQLILVQFDLIPADYRVRGFTRDLDGKKLFIDHDITSIQDFIDRKTLEKYDAIDVNVYQSNIFHTRMLIKDIDLQNYLFKTDVYELEPKVRLDISNSLRREMIEIFSGKNIY